MSVTSEELNYLIWRYLQEAGHEVTAFALQDETKVHELDERYSSRIQIGCLVDLVQKGILYSEDESLINHKGELKSKEELEKTFTLFGALRKNQNVDLKFSGRFALEGDEEVEEKIDTEKAKDTANGKQDQQESSNNNNDNDNDNNNNNNNNNATVNTNDKVDNKKHDNNNEKNGIIEEDISNEEFIKVLKKSQTFDNSVTTNWNPIAASVLSWGQRNSSAMIAVLQPESEKKPELVTLTHPLSLSADLSINPTSAKEEITVVSWAPKGHFLLTASENGELRLWTADGKLRNVLTLHQAPVITIRWNPDSTFILTQDSQNDTIIWDTNTGSAIQHIDYDFLKSQSQSQPSLTITQYNQSPENTVLGADATWIDSTKFLIPGVNGSIVFFQLGEKAPLGVLHGHTAAIGTLSYSSRLQLLASGSDDTTIRIWKGNSYSSAQVLLGHDQGIVCVDWLQSYAENIGLLISSSLDGSVRIWDVYSGSLLLASFLDGVPIFEAVLSPNQKWYAVGTEEGLVSIFDVSSETIKAVVDKTSIANEDSGISTIIGRLKIVAQYQPERANASINADGAAEDEPAVEDNFVTSLSWNCESTKLCISYNKLETVIIDL